MRCLAASLLSAFCICPAIDAQPPAGRHPVPAADALRTADAEALEHLRDLLATSVGVPQTAMLLLHRAAPADVPPAVRWRLLELSRTCAEESGVTGFCRQVIDAFARDFAVDGTVLWLECLDRLAAAGRTPATDLCYAYFAVAEQACVRGDAATRERALAAAEQAARRFRDPTLREYAAVRSADLRAVDRAIRALGDAPTADQQGRVLCFHRGLWDEGLGLLLEGDDARLAAVVNAKRADDLEGRTAISRAERWLAAADDATEPIVVENLRRRALHWYRIAWPLLEGLERDRVTKHMSRVEDLLAERPRPGVVRFRGEDDLRRMVIENGLWEVQDGLLIGCNDGPATRATVPYAFSRIDSVTIRGGIRSRANLNFRIAVGALNVIFNWEVAPENHFWFGEQRSSTSPPAFELGREHDLRVRNLDGCVYVFLDGEVIWQSNGDVCGTVSVYPALGSEIFVREIVVHGELEPTDVVEGADPGVR